VVWAVSLSTLNLFTQGLTTGRRIRRFSGLGNGVIHPFLPKSPLPRRMVLASIRCTTDIVFVENQLSPRSVSFSLLPKAHPMLLQQQRVRSPTFWIVVAETHHRRGGLGRCLRKGRRPSGVWGVTGATPPQRFYPLARGGRRGDPVGPPRWGRRHPAAAPGGRTLPEEGAAQDNLGVLGPTD